MSWSCTQMNLWRCIPRQRSVTNLRDGTTIPSLKGKTTPICTTSCKTLSCTQNTLRKRTLSYTSWTVASICPTKPTPTVSNTDKRWNCCLYESTATTWSVGMTHSSAATRWSGWTKPTLTTLQRFTPCLPNKLLTSHWTLTAARSPTAKETRTHTR